MKQEKRGGGGQRSWLSSPSLSGASKHLWVQLSVGRNSTSSFEGRMLSCHVIFPGRGNEKGVPLDAP